MTGQFQHGLFGCFDNCCICIVTYFVPCYAAGKVAEKVGESCVLHAVLCVCPLANLICRTIVRGKVRDQRGIPGSVIGDFCINWFCGVCALCQEAQETNAFGNQAMAAEQAIERQ
jgi:Cys-rich protein (TIGR01571 family)